MEAQEQLSADIHLLGDTLGKVIRQQAGVKLFGLVELARAYTKARRNDNDETINHTIDELIDTLSLDEKANLAPLYSAVISARPGIPSGWALPTGFCVRLR